MNGDDHQHRDTLRYVISVLFAVLVFVSGFYALVIYEFELDPLIVGAMISLMTLSAQHVFGAAAAAATNRAAQQSFAAGKTQQAMATEPAAPAEKEAKL